MNRKLLFAGAAVFSLFLSFAIVDSAQAAAGLDPNAIRRMHQRNFRRPVGEMERYRRNKRSLERRNIDQFTAPVEGESSFERREDYLRATQRRRIQEDLDARQYDGERRTTPHFWDRENRSGSTTIRRIGEAQRGGGIRLRRGTASLRQLRGLTSDEKTERIRQYREEVRAAETARYNFTSSDCSSLSGRRQAQCLYRQRRN
ncbi:MAG: hypothetical protein QF793_00695 [Candidatus Peribacteraceae bacterium]|nr:hypothetical protein [Candidatus Peribacteraceae bacterium]|tara:strand:+ start:17717 stop:18322 length:606 start_codon:yes stop_codon:yes gene_type:complete